MLHILIIFAWIVAFGCWAILAWQVAKLQLFDRNQKKASVRKSSGLRKLNPFGESHQDSVRNPGGSVLPGADVAGIGNRRRRGIALFGYFMLFLWEAYWVSEIVERFSRSSNPLQLPYFFLLVVTVGIPLGVYLIARWIIGRPVQSP